MKVMIKLSNELNVSPGIELLRNVQFSKLTPNCGEASLATQMFGYLCCSTVPNVLKLAKPLSNAVEAFILIVNYAKSTTS